jgi:DNA-binding LytR/AlgR family response regulator
MEARMKIRIELDDNLTENEVVIHCKSIDEEVMKVQQSVAEITSKTQTYIFYKGDTEYYLTLDQILFFETDGSGVCAHTTKDIFETHQKLYELERILPGYFLRISKSAICNADKIYSISRGLSSNSVVEFEGTQKKVYVSRRYYKPLRQLLEEKRCNH